MNGRIPRAVKEYRKRYYGRTDNSAAFFVTDYYEVIKAATESKEDDSTLEAIMIALEAGFMIGYRKAKRDLKERKAICTENTSR